MKRTKVDAMNVLLDAGWSVEEIEGRFDLNIQHLDSFVLPMVSWPNYPEPTCSEITCVGNKYFCKRLLGDKPL